MPRSHGRIQSAIWQDPDFIALDSEPQRLYLFLLSQADLSHAGLLPLRVRRWATKVGHQDTATLWNALAVLAARRFVIMDEETEELLVRTLVRNDGVYKQPKVMLRMREDAQQIESPALRRAFLAELNRLPLHELSDKPGGPAGDHPSTRETVATIVDALKQDFENPSGGVSDTHPDTHPDTPGVRTSLDDDSPSSADTQTVIAPGEYPSDTPPEGYREPPRVRARAFPQPPSPSPQPPSPVPPTAGDADAPPTAQTLVAEWVDHCGDRPPGKVVGQVASEVGKMLKEGIPYPAVRAGLVTWHERNLHPSTLPSVVHEVRQGPRRNGSTTDQRVNEGLRLVAHFARLDADDQQSALPPGESA